MPPRRLRCQALISWPTYPNTDVCPLLYSRSMNTYYGNAVIVHEHGAETLVTASLRSYRDGLRTGWEGALTAAPDDLREMANLDEGRLRFPDGREVEFLRPDRSDWAHFNQLNIIGQDEAPF